MIEFRSFDLLSGYSLGRQTGTIDERTVTVRCIFLETVAGAYRVCHNE